MSMLERFNVQRELAAKWRGRAGARVSVTL